MAYHWINAYNMTEREEETRDEMHKFHKYYCFVPESEAIVGDVFFFFDSLEDITEKTIAANYIRNNYKETESFDVYLSVQGKSFYNQMHDLFTENFQVPIKEMRRILKNFLEWNEDRDEGIFFKCSHEETETINIPGTDETMTICQECGKEL